MMTLYGAMMSRAHRVVWMLEELGVEYRHVETDFLHGGTHTREFLAINPNGRVPALDDDGLLLCESLSINLYLATKYPSPLSPASLREQALITQWSFWVVTEIEKPLLLAAANRLLFAEAERSAVEAEMALARLDRPLGVLDAHLASKSFLVGERFTVADLNVAAVMTLIRLAKIGLQRYRAVDDWLTCCLERPSARHWKGIEFRIPRPDSALGMLKMFV